MSLKNMDAFKRRYNQAVKKQMAGKDIAPSVEFDAVLSLADAGLPLIQLMDKLAPFGMGNGKPVFAGRGLRVDSFKVIGSDGNHVRINLRSGSAAVVAMGWRMAAPEFLSMLEESRRFGRTVDALFNLDVNEWNGRRSVQLVLKDLRPSRAGSIEEIPARPADAKPRSVSRG